VKVGINGMGRIGRLALRLLADPQRARTNQLQPTHLNDPGLDAASVAHLLSFDSVQGYWPVPCNGSGDALQAGDRVLRVTRERSIAAADFSDCDLVIEATGVHHKPPEGLQAYRDAGVAAVVAAPVAGIPNLVMGVNHGSVDLAAEPLLSAASCTTNCLAPLVKVVHEALGIERGSLTTIHSLTNTQTIVDGAHKDLRRARACGSSLIPTSTGSATAIGRIFPELDGKLDDLAVRVPLLTASLTDAVFEVARPTTAEAVNALFTAAAAGPLAGILGVESRPLVSVDFVGDPRSAIVDLPSTRVIDGRQLRLYAWYDNEWGYANRLVELVEEVALAREGSPA